MISPSSSFATHGQSISSYTRAIVLMIAVSGLTLMSPCTRAQFRSSNAVAPPIYFEGAGDGAAFTYDYVPADALSNRTARLVRRPVTPPEIEALEQEGYTVAYLNRASKNISGKQRDAITQLSSLPSSFSIIERFGVIYGNFYVEGTQPAGSTTQWVSYYVNTYGYPQSSHTAVGLLVDTSVIQTAAVGNGMLFGAATVSRAPGWEGCGYAGYPIFDSQIESFWNSANETGNGSLGNWLYSDSCYPSGLVDGGHSYGITVSASTSSWVAYQVSDMSTNQTWHSPAEYTNAQRPIDQQISPSTAKAGIFFAAVFPGPDDFSIYFSGVTSGWF